MSYTRIKFDLHSSKDIDHFKAILRYALKYWADKEVDANMALDYPLAKVYGERVGVLKQIIGHMVLKHHVEDLLEEIEPFDEEIIKGNVPER